MMNGFERRKEEKKEIIIRAALELFSAYGFKKVSMHDIAQKADVSPVTIYNHFGNKDGLIKETILTQFHDMITKYRNVIHGDGTFAEKMETIIFEKVGISSQFQGELARTLLRGNPELQQLFDEKVMPESIKLIIELFEIGKKEGYISRNISNQTIIIYLEVIRAGIQQSEGLYSIDQQAYPQVMKELNELFLYGLVDTGDRAEFRKQKKA